MPSRPGVRWEAFGAAAGAVALTIVVQWWRTGSGRDAPALLDWLPSLLHGFGMATACLAIPRLPRGAILWAGAGVLLYECLQPLLPARTFDPSDLLAGAGGLALAAAMGRRWNTGGPRSIGGGP